MLKPKVPNKYNLKPRDICRAIILKPEALQKQPFWRNDIIDAWCLSETTAKNAKDEEFGCYNSYWIGFYDEDAKAYKGKIRLSCSSYGDMCHYNFNTFYNEKDITSKLDLEIQEKLLERINWLIDEGIIMIPEKPKKENKKCV